MDKESLSNLENLVKESKGNIPSIHTTSLLLYNNTEKIIENIIFQSSNHNIQQIKKNVLRLSSEKGIDEKLRLASNKIFSRKAFRGTGNEWYEKFFKPFIINLKNSKSEMAVKLIASGILHTIEKVSKNLSDVLMIPILTKKKEISALHFFSKRNGKISERDRKLIDAFCNSEKFVLNIILTKVELAESEEKHRTLVDIIPEIIYRIDPQGKFLFLSESISLLGYTSSELIGKHFSEIIHPDDVNKAKRNVVIQKFIGKKTGDKDSPKLFDERRTGKRGTRDLEIRLQKKQAATKGTQFEMIYGEVTAVGEYDVPVFEKNKKLLGTVGVIRDITERKKKERELRKSIEKAKESDRLKSAFLANMSHEIRTPMNGIMGMLSLLMEMDITPEQRDYIEVAIKSSDSLMTLINDILDLSKIESEKLDLEMIDFDLRISLDDVCEMMVLKAEQKNVIFNKILSHSVPTLLYGDPGRLKQILVNLINNALKFTEKGNVTIMIDVEKETDVQVTLKISISDTGVGIPKDKLKSIFQRFSQADVSITRKYGGTGLGLSISKKLTEMMGGKIGVVSEEGKGSTFWFTAKFKKQPEQKVLYPSIFKNIKGLRILVVDDNSVNRYVLSEMLHRHKCHIDEASSAKEALAKFRRSVDKNETYDIAIIDMQMPDVDGKTLGKEIKNEPTLKEIPLIMLTSMANRGDAADMKKIGFSAYLTKPIKHKQLYNALSMVLGIKNQESEGASGPFVTKHYLTEASKAAVRFLLAEDNPINQNVMTKMLKKYGYHCEVVVNGKEAVEATVRNRYNIIFMDCNMPGMNGYEAATIIRKNEGEKRHSKIIALTAHAMKGDRQKCLDAGMDDYIAKPIMAQELIKIIENHL